MKDNNIDADYNFLMVCNNYIVSILEEADKRKWSSENIKFKDKDKGKVNSNKYDIFYFRNNGYANIINKSLYKHIIFSLVSDYNLYVSDAIESARKNHFGPAFALLRKPLKDDLLLIEMFYVKGHRFVGKFLNSSIENYSIDKIDVEKKKIIMRKCCKQINFFTSKRLYDLRYNRNSKVSLEKIWEKSIHIITNNKAYATEDGNLNIIFATSDIVEENITYFFKVVTSIQLYFVTLLLNILKEEKLISEDEFTLNLTQIYFAYSCTLKEKIPKECLKELSFKCTKCNKAIFSTEQQIKENYKNNRFEYCCSNCKKRYVIDKFVFK